MTDDLVNKLRAVDHFSLEDCFCQSPLYDKAADRIEALTAERDQWAASFDEACAAWQQQCEHEMDKTKAAEAERDRLRGALTFYADPETYQDIFVAEDCECCHRREHPAIEDDNGKVARAALKGEKA